MFIGLQNSIVRNGLIVPTSPGVVIMAPNSDGNDGLIATAVNLSTGANGEFVLSTWVYPLTGFTSGMLFGTAANISV